MLVGWRPDEGNDQLVAAGAFHGANLLSPAAAEHLGLDYAGEVREIDRVPSFCPAIRDVDYTRDGGEFVRHFVLLVDPYGAVRRPLDYYRFVSYRRFSQRARVVARNEAASGAAGPA